MPKNTTTLKLGGKLRTLEFNFGTLDHIADITGADPLVFSMDPSDYKSIKKGVSVLVEAGYKSGGNEDPFEVDWVKSMPISSLNKVIAAWAYAKSDDASGEVEPDTQPPAANVATA